MNGLNGISASIGISMFEFWQDANPSAVNRAKNNSFFTREI